MNVQIQGRASKAVSAVTNFAAGIAASASTSARGAAAALAQGRTEKHNRAKQAVTDVQAQTTHEANAAQAARRGRRRLGVVKDASDMLAMGIAGGTAATSAALAALRKQVGRAIELVERAGLDISNLKQSIDALQADAVLTDAQLARLEAVAKHLRDSGILPPAEGSIDWKSLTWYPDGDGTPIHLWYVIASILLTANASLVASPGADSSLMDRFRTTNKPLSILGSDDTSRLIRLHESAPNVAKDLDVAPGEVVIVESRGWVPVAAGVDATFTEMGVQIAALDANWLPQGTTPTRGWFVRRFVVVNGKQGGKGVVTAKLSALVGATEWALLSKHGFSAQVVAVASPVFGWTPGGMLAGLGIPVLTETFAQATGSPAMRALNLGATRLTGYLTADKQSPTVFVTQST